MRDIYDDIYNIQRFVANFSAGLFNFGKGNRKLFSKRHLKIWLNYVYKDYLKHESISLENKYIERCGQIAEW